MLTFIKRIYVKCMLHPYIYIYIYIKEDLCFLYPKFQKDTPFSTHFLTYPTEEVSYKRDSCISYPQFHNCTMLLYVIIKG